MRYNWLILLLLASGAAHAASFDCAKAKTPQEKAICASPQLSAADDQMAAAYKAVLAAATPEIAAELRDGQRAWIRGRDVKCAAGASQSSTELAACLLNDEESRTRDLQHMVLRQSGVTFVWRSITVTAPDDPNTLPPEIQSHERNPGYRTLSASWPQAISDTPGWSAWNKAIEEATQKMASQESNDASGNSQRKWAAVGGVDTDMTVSIGVVGEQMVAATINDFFDGHGAHPVDTSIQFNWLLKEQRELRPEDVFRPGSGWDTAIQGQCESNVSQQLIQQLGADNANMWLADLPKALHGIILDPKNWIIDSKGLTIPFQPYAVACTRALPTR
jgi:uncharacterized protein YecT (DUF1311 family)